MQTSEMRPRLLAFLAVLAFFGLIWLYVREFPVFSNTIGAGRLVGGSIVAGLAAATFILYFLRRRLMPWKRHLPEVFFIGLLLPLFAPLFGSLLNRAVGKTENQSFEFVAEGPYIASNYGILKGEKLRPTGYGLIVKENGRELKFKYKTQPYYPLTKPGETILLPVRTGLFGFRVVLLK